VVFALRPGGVLVGAGEGRAVLVVLVLVIQAGRAVLVGCCALVASWSQCEPEQ